MKRMLHIVGGMYPGGLENFIMNIYRNLDREQVQFDIIVHKFQEGDYRNEIEKMGGKIYLAPRKAGNPLKNFMAIRKIVKENGYEIVIRHSDNAFPVVDMVAAAFGGAKKRIYQSHSSDSSHKLLHYFFRMWMGFAVTDRFACSENAGKWMYKNRKFKVIKNAIDVERFRYRKEVRERIRQEWDMQDKRVYCHVGIYMPVKNHAFLINTFACLLKEQPEARLLLIGEGDLRPDMEKQIEKLGLQGNVILTGIRSDVAELLQMGDVFMFPSIYEGLPLSVIEAQTAGLPCLISDVITDEVMVTDLVTKMPLSAGEEAWAKKALALSEPKERKDYGMQVTEAGYNVQQLAKWYAGL